MFENPSRGRQARNCTTNVPKLLDLKSSFEQIFDLTWLDFPKIDFGCPSKESTLGPGGGIFAIERKLTSCIIHHLNPFTPYKGIQIPESGKFLLVESGIQIKESGIGIQNSSSTNKDWNPVPGIRNPRRGIQSPKSRLELSWIAVTCDKSILKGKWQMVNLTTNPCSAVFSLWAVYYLT